MSEQLISMITEQLHQEKWTRATIGNYTTQVFKELDELLEEVFEQKCQEEILALCEEHMQLSKNSIIALYISGIINLTKQSINDANLLILINIFIENNRWKIVESLAERILGFGENKHAYRTLAKCYEAESNETKKYEVWEKLIRVDYEEADIVKLLAERAEGLGKTEEAIQFYKKALHRYINRKMFSQVREIWKKLIDLASEEVEFFFHAEGKASKVLGEDRAVQLLEDLYPAYKAAEKWDIALDILKKIVNYDPKSPTARNELVICYRNKHQNHSQLEECLRMSNIGASWRSVHDAIADFEKHISFDAGNYVHHRTWGVGRIMEIKDDFITIDFIKTKGHKMSLKLAVSALTILGKDHIWVCRTTQKKDELKKKVLKDPIWALKTIIKSFDNQADMKRVKLELADSKLLEPNEWTSWSSKARQLLKTDESFGNMPDKPDVYMVREQPISLEEKFFNRFKAEKEFFNRIKILQEFLGFVQDQDQQSSVESDLFREMFGYFVAYVRNMSQVNEFTLGSMLVVRSVIEHFNFLNPGVNLNFREAIEALGPDTEAVFLRLNNAELRREFLGIIRKHTKNWPPIYLRLLPLQLHKDNINDLIKAGYTDKVQELFTNAFTAYRDNREVAVWFLKNCREEEWFKELNIPSDKILIALIHLLDITARELENKKDLSENRRLNRQASTILFKENMLIDYLGSADKDGIGRVYNLMEESRGVEHEFSRQAKTLIKKRFPDFKFKGENDKDREIETSNRSTFFALYHSYEEKSRALQNLQEVEVAKNSKEISIARDFGDLKENAEYKAAKERQEILNATAAKWKNELDHAKAFNIEEVDASRVGFGTKVLLINEDTKTEETYTIMGPWESNPDEGVISYLSPFGAEIYRKGPGEKLKFVINERTYQYSIKSIVKADLTKIKTTTQLTV